MQDLSKAKISLIRSLSQKKYREQHNLFIAEGQKIIDEIAKSDYRIKHIIYNQDKDFDYVDTDTESFITDNVGMKKISALKTPPAILAVVEQKDNEIFTDKLKEKLCLVTDDIQDPGNLGTLMRICDWFGIENLICSNNSADLYNPKVIQASMGAFLRVNVHYTNLTDFIPDYKSHTENQCFGTFLDGENIYQSELPEKGLIILGNEGNGISKEVESLVDKKLHIPSFAKGSNHAESLNISVAAAIVVSEFKRRPKTGDRSS